MNFAIAETRLINRGTTGYTAILPAPSRDPNTSGRKWPKTLRSKLNRIIEEPWITVDGEWFNTEQFEEYLRNRA